MKFSNIINEEGSFTVNGYNGLVDVNITDIHPELTLYDNSMLIFESVKVYYEFIGNANVYNGNDGEICLDNLLSDYPIVTDTISDYSYKNNDVNSITRIMLDSGSIYFIQRTGKNPVLEYGE